MGGDEVFQNAQPFAQAGFNREVDDSTGRIGHQTSHAGHLFNLGDVTFGSGGGHHIDTAGAVHTLGQDIGQSIGDFGPDLNHTVITFIFSD